MSLTDQITADQAAVVTAQAALDAANAKLATDQAAFTAIQPHLTILDNIEAELSQEASSLEGSAVDAFNFLRIAVLPYIEQMRNLFNA